MAANFESNIVCVQLGLLFLMCITLHLSTLNFICRFTAHSVLQAASATLHTQLETSLAQTALQHLQTRLYWICNEDKCLHHSVSLNISEGSTPDCSDCEHCKYFINSGKPKSEINKPRSHLHYKELLYCRNWLQLRSPRHSYYNSA